MTFFSTHMNTWKIDVERGTYKPYRLKHNNQVLFCSHTLGEMIDYVEDVYGKQMMMAFYDPLSL